MVEAGLKTKLTPTDEQIEVIDAVGGTDSVMVDALAGCSKSTTLEMSAPGVKVPAMAMAFNKKIAEDLKPRLPGNFTVKTFNGLGFGAVLKALPAVGKAELDDKKLGKLVSQVAKDRKVSIGGDQWDQLRCLVRGAQQCGIVPENRGRPLTLDTKEAWEAIADDLWIPRPDFEFLADMAHEVLERNNQLTEQGVLSFDDQVYYSTCIAGQFPKFPVIFVDEAQDLSPLNHAMLALSVREDGRLVVVGDPKQCHPPGTVIQLSKGRSKLIEDIEIGDELVSYNRKTKFSGINTQGRRVLDKQMFPFNGELVVINTEGPYTQECTPNHKCMVRWCDKAGYSLYLMQKGNRFRMGIAQNWYNDYQGSWGPGMRARQEKADALWVLASFDKKDDAMIQEKVAWTQFGLPDLIFRSSGKASSTQAHLDAAWEAIGDNSSRAKKCLEFYRRRFDFPLWSKEDKKHIGEKVFITQACNLLGGVMEVKVFDGTDTNGTWLRVWPDYCKYNGAVYGITVEPNGYGQNLYVANGIVTHNSIYAFRGAVSEGMKKMRSLRPVWQDRPLFTTFRCPKKIVERQQRHAPGYKAWHTNPEGVVHRLKSSESDSGGINFIEQGWNWEDVLKVLPNPKSQVMVLCRNNGPLLSLAFKLLRAQIGVVMLGRDIGKGLIALSNKVLKDDGTPTATCVALVTDWIESESSLTRANGHDEKVTGITDRGECLIAVLSSGCRDAGELRSMLTKLFARDTGQVELSSIHRAKGLERDVIFHLDPWRIPSRYAREAAKAGDTRQLEQENNLRYVAETRTRHTFIEGNLEDYLG